MQQVSDSKSPAVLHLGALRGSLGKINICDYQRRRLYWKEYRSSEAEVPKKGLCVSERFCLCGSEDEMWMKPEADPLHLQIQYVFFFLSVTHFAASQPTVWKSKALEEEWIPWLCPWRGCTGAVGRTPPLWSWVPLWGVGAGTDSCMDCLPSDSIKEVGRLIISLLNLWPINSESMTML